MAFPQTFIFLLLFFFMPRAPPRTRQGSETWRILTGRNRLPATETLSCTRRSALPVTRSVLPRPVGQTSVALLGGGRGCGPHQVISFRGWHQTENTKLLDGVGATPLVTAPRDVRLSETMTDTVTSLAGSIVTKDVVTGHVNTTCRCFHSSHHFDTQSKPPKIRPSTSTYIQDTIRQR